MKKKILQILPLETFPGKWYVQDEYLVGVIFIPVEAWALTQEDVGGVINLNIRAVIYDEFKELYVTRQSYCREEDKAAVTEEHNTRRSKKLLGALFGRDQKEEDS